MSIYVIETPQRGAPLCWVAEDEQGFIGRVETSEGGDGYPEEVTFADAWKHLSASLQDLTMFESTDDAAEYLLDKWGKGGIKQTKSWHALATQVNYRINEITDHETKLRILGIMWAPPVQGA